MVRHEARVVAFDPDLDLAILAVDNLDAPALKRAGAVERGTSTVVAGYPLGGAYTLAASRVRGVVDDGRGRGQSPDVAEDKDGAPEEVTAP